MPPDSVRAVDRRRSQKLQLLEVALGAFTREPPRDAVVAGLIRQDRLDRLELIEIDLLRYDADAGFSDRDFAIDVVAEDADGAATLIHERGDDADRGRLAGTVGPEQRKEVALLDVQIDPFQRLDPVPVGLREIRD